LAAALLRLLPVELLAEEASGGCRSVDAGPLPEAGAAPAIDAAIDPGRSCAE